MINQMGGNYFFQFQAICISVRMTKPIACHICPAKTLISRKNCNGYPEGVKGLPTTTLPAPVLNTLFGLSETKMFHLNGIFKKKMR